MLEPLMIENLGKKNFLDKINSGVKGQPVMDQTFNEVFDSLQKTDQKNENIHNHSSNDNNEDRGLDHTDRDNDYDGLDEYEHEHEHEHEHEQDYDREGDDAHRPMESSYDSDDVTEHREQKAEEPVVAEVEKPKEDSKLSDDKEPENVNENKIDKAMGDRPHANKSAALVKAANEAIQKLNQLLKDDPLALKKIFEGTDDKTFGGILKSLGMSDDSLKELSKFVDLDQELSAKAMNALKSGKPAAIINLLKNAGLDKSTLDQASAAIGRKLEGMKPQEQSEAVARETEKETFEGETDESTDGNEHEIKSHGKPSKKVSQVHLHAAGQAKEVANPNSAVKTPQGAIDKAAIDSSKAVPKVEAAPQTVKGSTSNVDINITNNGPQKAEATQAMSKAQVLNKSQGFEKMLMNQIIEKVRINIRQNGRSNMTIRLDPPSLGKVEVRVITQANMVQALMVVENREVKAVAEANIDSLKTALSNSGLKVDEVVVTTADEGHQFKNENLSQEPGFGFNNRHGLNTSDGETGFGDGNDIETDNVRKSVHNGVLNVVA